MKLTSQQWAAQWGLELPSKEAFNLSQTLARYLSAEFKVELSFHDLWNPGTCGQALLQKMGVDLTPLPKDLQLLIANTSCQHRIELYPRTGDVPRLVYYDGRAMYMGCCNGLGIAGGKFRHVEGEDIKDNERGRARVRFMVPDGWAHVGLLPVKDEVSGWFWPCSDKIPWWQTWADLCEIRFARRQGWQVDVLEKIVWPEDRPLDLWAARLSRLYLKAKERGCDELAACYRSVCLHTIGRFHNLGYIDERRVVQLDGGQATFDNTERIDEQGAHIRERVKFNKPEEFCHPEWSAAIWSRCHLKVARALTSVSRETLIGVRGDAIYLTEVPNVEPAQWRIGGTWYDDGGAGRVRLKADLKGPLPAPQTWGEIRGLFDGS